MARKTTRTLGFAAVLPAMAMLLPSTVSAEHENRGDYGTPAPQVRYDDLPGDLDVPSRNAARLDELIHKTVAHKAALDSAVDQLIYRFRNDAPWTNGPSYTHGRPGRGSYDTFWSACDPVIENIKTEGTIVNRLLKRAQARVHSLESQVSGLQCEIEDLEKQNYQLMSERDRLIEENERLRRMLSKNGKHSGGYVTARNTRRGGSARGWRHD